MSICPAMHCASFQFPCLLVPILFVRCIMRLPLDPKLKKEFRIKQTNRFLSLKKKVFFQYEKPKLSQTLQAVSQKHHAN